MQNKNLTIIILVAVAIFLCAWNSDKNEIQTTQKDLVNATTTVASGDTAKFDINSIPVSDKDLGAFPFF